ncbi:MULTISPECIES: FlgD immunoglobulin-like domain containing protein [unclassified Knoellia]|uniref:FlgD immunoglobulin-like domain containing protein n=1 Tax=Knoellia altitudinis TaxID=3404795 RepID=UPI0036152F1D
MAVALSGSSNSTVVVMPNSGGQTNVTSLAHPLGGSGYIMLHGIVGSTVAYDAVTFDGDEKWTTNTYRKAPGSSAETIAAEPTNVAHLAISATDTFYATQETDSAQMAYYRKPVGQAAVQVSGIAIWPSLIAPAGAGFLVAGQQREDSGIYTVVGTAVKRVWTPPLPALSALSVAAAPGRALWSDDRRTDEPLWSRSVTGTAALTAGAEALIGTRVSGGVFSVSGRRTVWTNRDTGKLVVQDGLTSQNRPELGLVRAMSGHRVLSILYPATGAGDPTVAVTNLVTGTRTAAPFITAIWGNVGVGFDALRNIVKQDLTTGTRSVLVPTGSTGVPTDGWAEDPIVEGDLVAWISHGNDGSTQINWRNLRTGAQSSRPAATDTFLSNLSIRGAALVAIQSSASSEPGSTVYSAYALDTASGTQMPDVISGPATFDDTVLKAGPSGLAWVSPNGQPKVSPMPDQHLRPRHEGNPFAPTTFNAGSGATQPWVGEWVFTDPLTACSVQVKNDAASLVRTLACDPTYAKQGEAVASWDGKDATGTVVPSGTYTWTVLGRDADGSALDTDGVSTSITGSIAVTGAVVADKYVALTPARLVDTRSGTGAPKAPVGSGKEIAVQVTGEGGVPTTGVSSVVLNVTAVAPTAGGYATIYPSGTSRPTASNINYAQGATIANQVIVKVGADGKARLFTSAATNVIVDVAGYYPPGSRYTGLPPARLLDTRTGVGAPTVRIPAGGTVNLQVTGRGGVPTTGAASVAFNITAVNPSAGGYITAWPTGTVKPNASNVNFAKAQTIAGLAVAKLGTGGKISISSSAATDLLLDVAGWFPTSSDFHGTVPARILDTRLGTGAPAAPVDGGGTLTLQVAGKGGVPATGIKAVLVNVTVVGPTTPGFLTAYPSTAARPTASNLNFGKGQSIANTVLAKLGTDGKIKLYTSAGTHLITDVQGYITN